MWRIPVQYLFDKCEEWLVDAVAYIVKSGPVPRHVAIIMDGNRRFARQNSMESVVDGHKAGSENLIKALKWLLKLGVRAVSVYAFSIENFKRSSSEVSGLMDLAVDKLLEMATENSVIMQKRCKVEVVGNLALLPEKVRAASEEVMKMTRDNDAARLNICLSYTSRDDITHAIGDSIQSFKPEDICVASVKSKLRVHDCEDVDLLIRTSGETRLSDFLTWQVGFAELVFVRALWPEFNLRHLFYACLRYQLSYHSRKQLKARYETSRESTSLTCREQDDERSNRGRGHYGIHRRGLGKLYGKRGEEHVNGNGGVGSSSDPQVLKRPGHADIHHCLFGRDVKV